MKRLCLSTLLTLALLAPTLAADKSLVLYLPFDEGSGTVAKDASSYKNNGDIVGDAAWVEGYKGTALEFVNGSRVTIPEIPEYDISAEVSLLAWVKATENPNWGRVIDKSQWQTSGFDLVLTQNVGLARLEFFVASTTSLVDSTTVVMDGEWHFIAGTFGDKTLRAYVDGVLEGESTSVGDVDINPNDLALMIAGESSSNGGQQLLGTVDEAAMFNRTLSDAEIMNIFLNGMAVPERAADPQPENEAVDVPRDVVLGWTAGGFAATHDVYFGTNAEDVNNAERGNPLDVLVSQGQTGTSYDPEGILEFGHTYYWRVDEVNAAPDDTIFKGEVWSFTAEPFSYAIKNITATSNGTSDPTSGPEKTVDGSGLNADGQHSTLNTDMWAGSTGGAEPVWIQYEFDKVYKLYEMQVWNYNVMFEMLLGFGFKDVTIEYSEDGVDWMLLQEALFAQATARADYTANTTVDFQGVAAKYVRLTANSAYGVSGQVGLSEVRFLYLPVQAREPEPADGATDVSIETLLDWRAGREASSHQVYLGTDAEALALVDTVADSQYNPGGLDLATTYYWQINEVNEAEAISAWDGAIWSFVTQEYLSVDDFESYNDDDNRIYEAWIDGIDVPANGSQVGYLDAPFAEQSIVHSGRQSMPLLYANTGSISYSEVEMTLSGGQDWTQAGLTTLTLYFYGDLENDAAQVYVKINGTKITGGGSTALALWKQWNIDLASTGANLSNVTSLIVGVEGSGSGTIYVDDIRLYQTAPVAVAPVDPGTANLAAHYTFENNVTDSSGNGRDGTPMNDPFYEDAPGDLGRAIMFDGINDYVDLPIGSLIGSLSDMSMAMWVNFSGSNASWQRIFDFGSGTTSYIMLTPQQGTSGPMTAAIVGAGIPEKRFVAPDTLATGWHHVAVTVDSATMTIELYLDGAVVASDSTEVLPKDLGQTTQNWLGRSQWEADAYFTGSLADFSIYSRALSAGEVRYLAGDR